MLAHFQEFLVHILLIGRRFEYQIFLRNLASTVFQESEHQQIYNEIDIILGIANLVCA